MKRVLYNHKEQENKTTNKGEQKMITRNNDEKTIIYLVNRKIAMNMKLIKLYGDKAEYSDFPKEKLFAQYDKMRRIRQLFIKGFITFDDAVKAIANDSIDNDFYQKYK